MLAQFKMELIGSDSYSMFRAMKKIMENIMPGSFGKIPTPYFVAKIIGFDKKYKFKRLFLRGKKDYSKSNNRGSRGIYAYFELESGKIYDVKEKVSWKRTLRYFIEVDNEGNIKKISEDEVKEWLTKNISA